jgi:hypothetical protein
MIFSTGSREQRREGGQRTQRRWGMPLRVPGEEEFRAKAQRTQRTMEVLRGVRRWGGAGSEEWIVKKEDDGRLLPGKTAERAEEDEGAELGFTRIFRDQEASFDFRPFHSSPATLPNASASSACSAVFFIPQRLSNGSAIVSPAVRSPANHIPLCVLLFPLRPLREIPFPHRARSGSPCYTGTSANRSQTGSGGSGAHIFKGDFCTGWRNSAFRA